jgi:hypothetical protein
LPVPVTTAFVPFFFAPRVGFCVAIYQRFRTSIRYLPP